MFKIIQGFY